MKKFTHIDQSGKAKMVDVGNKPFQIRTAIAKGKIFLSEETRELIKENNMKKGDVLTISQIAGIQAAKKTSELIPLCHNLNLTKVNIESKLTEEGVEIIALARCIGQTGVEMEALTGVSTALLTIYDMCKAVDKNMIISEIQLIEKTKK